MFKFPWRKDPAAAFFKTLPAGRRINNDFLVRLVNHFRCRRVAEVGVWKGWTSKRLLAECPSLEQLILVDPLEHARNLFETDGRTPHPAMMQPGVYNCQMGEETLTQSQLDAVYRDLVADLNRDYPGRTTFHRMPSLQGAKQVANGSLDLVFIDAIHLYEDVKEDVAAWTPKLCSHGILTGDDYGDAFPGVMQAVDELFPGSMRWIDEPSGVWCVFDAGLQQYRQRQAA